MLFSYNGGNDCGTADLLLVGVDAAGVKVGAGVVCVAPPKPVGPKLAVEGEPNPLDIPPIQIGRAHV